MLSITMDTCTKSIHLLCTKKSMCAWSVPLISTRNINNNNQILRKANIQKEEMGNKITSSYLQSSIIPQLLYSSLYSPLFPFIKQQKFKHSAQVNSFIEHWCSPLTILSILHLEVVESKNVLHRFTRQVIWTHITKNWMIFLEFIFCYKYSIKPPYVIKKVKKMKST